MGSETLPSACYILFDESSIPFYSTSNGYNKWNVQRPTGASPLSRSTAVQLLVPIGILKLEEVGERG